MSELKASSSFLEFEQGSGPDKNIISVYFQQSKARLFPMIMKVASSAAHFAETSFCDKKVYGMAVDSKEARELVKLIFILPEVIKWTGTQTFVNGFPLAKDQAYKLVDVLRCFLESLKCDDPRAHCLSTDVITDDIYDGMDSLNGAVLVLPCRRIAGYYGALEGLTGVPINDRVQALGVREQCHICANFKKTNTIIRR